MNVRMVPGLRVDDPFDRRWDCADEDKGVDVVVRGRSNIVVCCCRDPS